MRLLEMLVTTTYTESAFSVEIGSHTERLPGLPIKGPVKTAK